MPIFTSPGVNVGRPRVAVSMTDPATHLRMLAEAVNRLIGGQLDCNGQVTLTPNATVTTAADPRMSIAMTVALTPTTASAAAAIPTTWWTVAKGLLTVNHASAATTDRTFNLAMIG